MNYWQMHHRLDSLLVRRFSEVIKDRNGFLNALERIPTCLCHGDADRRNLKFRVKGNDDEELVAFDWALAGLSVLGDDVHRLIHSAVMFKVDSENLKELEQLAYSSYINNLSDAGWKDDDRVVRLGFTTSSVVQSFIVILAGLMSRLREKKWIALYEEFLECQFSEMLVRILSLFEYQMDLAGETTRLMKETA